jgi:anti-sigma factor RsiW
MMNGLENWAINAYADGELDPLERSNVERLLESDADARRVLDGIQRQTQALKAAYDSALTEPLPHTLRATVSGRTERRIGPYSAIAASLAMLVLGTAGGWYTAYETGSTLVADTGRRAINAHEVFAVEVKHPVEVGANESDHIEKWLTKRIGVNVRIPDLASAGYTFIGGRLLAAEDRPAGQLMYEDSNKKRLTVFVQSNPGGEDDETIRVREKGAVISCYWAEHKLAMALTGDLPRDDMMKLAQEVYEQMENG